MHQIQFPEVDFKLDLLERRKLGGLLKFETRPKGIPLARWAVFTLGAASHISEWELAILSDALGYSVAVELLGSE